MVTSYTPASNTDGELLNFSDFFRPQLERLVPPGIPGVSIVRLKDPDKKKFWMFTKLCQKVNIHYMGEPYNQYVLCLGDVCPVCNDGTTSYEYLLIPAYSLSEKCVQVLRVPVVEKPDTYYAQIGKCLVSPNILQSAVIVSRKGNRYTVEQVEFDWGSINRSVLEAFEKKLQSGDIKLSNLFLRLSSDDMAKTIENEPESQTDNGTEEWLK